MVLTDEQRERLVKYMEFIVPSSSARRFFRVHFTPVAETLEELAREAVVRAEADGWLLELLEGAFGPHSLMTKDDRIWWLDVQTPLTIGSAPDNDVILKGKSVAPHHARLVFGGDGFYVEDLGSERGTFLNGERITVARLGRSTTLGFGRVKLFLATSRPPLDDSQPNALPPDEVNGQPEPAHIGASAPESARPGEEFTARLIAWHPRHQAEAERAAQQLGATVHLNLTPLPLAWAIGIVVEVRLYGDHLSVDPPEQRFQWDGALQAVDFDVRLSHDVPQDVLTTRLKFDLFLIEPEAGGASIARVRVPLKVVRAQQVRAVFDEVLPRLPEEPVTLEAPRALEAPRPPEAPPPDALPQDDGFVFEPQALSMAPAVTEVSGPNALFTARAFRSAYASYEASDQPRVAERINALQQACGIEIFHSALSLAPDEDRKPVLAEQIAQKEHFYLFWSPAAATSPSVRWEWNTALEARGLEHMELQRLDDTLDLPPELAALAADLPPLIDVVLTAPAPLPVIELNGQQKRALRDALLSAFPDHDNWAIFLSDRLALNVNLVTGPDDSLTEVVFDVIQHQEAQGLLAALVMAALEERPQNPKLRAFAVAQGLG